MKRKRLLSVWGQVFFYSALIGVFFFVTKIPTIGYYDVEGYRALGYNGAENVVGVKELVRSFLPILMGNNWFATCYILFYLFTPPLYILQDNLDQKKHLYLVFLLIVAGNIISMIPGQNVLHASRLYYFISGYFIACYIRKYNPSILHHTLFNFIASIIIIIFLAVWKCSLIYLSEKISFLRSDSVRFIYLGGTIEKLPVFLAALLFFCGFKNLRIPNSKIINLVASTTFGIYLLHVNGHLKYLIWHKIFLFDDFVSKPYFAAYVLLTSLCIFVVFSIIEMIRKFVFSKISDKIHKKEIAGNNWLFCRKRK